MQKTFKILVSQNYQFLLLNKELIKKICQLIDWKNLIELIPKFYSDNKMKKTGITGIFAASLELTKEGIISIQQKKISIN